MRSSALTAAGRIGSLVGLLALTAAAGEPLQMPSDLVVSRPRQVIVDRLSAEEQPPSEAAARLRWTLEERWEAWRIAYQSAWNEYSQGSRSVASLQGLAARFAAADLDLARTPVERVTSSKRTLALFRIPERIVQAKYDVGARGGSALDLALAIIAPRLGAEIAVADAEQAAAPDAAARQRFAAEAKRLRLAHRDLLRRAVEMSEAIRDAIGIEADLYVSIAEDRLRSELAIAATPQERLAVKRQFLEASKANEYQAAVKHEMGGFAMIEYAAAKAQRAAAEIAVLREEASAKGGPPESAAKIREWATKRRDALAHRAAAIRAVYDSGAASSVIDVLEADSQAAEAAVDLAQSPQEQAAARERALKTAAQLARQAERIVRTHYLTGSRGGSRSAYAHVKGLRLDAEAALLRHIAEPRHQ